MRRALDALYNAAGAVAGLGLIALLLAVVASILGRQFGALNIIGIDAYAGYAMATCGFLGMAYTLREGGHIRVVMLLQALGTGQRRRWVELPALAISVVLVGLLCYYSIEQAWESYQYMDISINNDATPLWIPQIAMAVGNTIFFVATVDQCIQALLHGRFWDGSIDDVRHSE
ncbi:MAG: TRAP transporter small permease [Candidimonas sp.]|jgi:TRAP-type C4-dicarboxylate transport system permease small subunit